MLTAVADEPWPRISKTRSRPLPSMIVAAAPAPWMVTLLVMFRSPVCPAVSLDPAMVSLYVPAGTMIVLGPGLALAWRIASRSEKSPGTALASFSSAVVLTVKVDSSARVSSTSNRPMRDRRARGDAARKRRLLVMALRLGVRMREAGRRHIGRAGRRGRRKW